MADLFLCGIDVGQKGAIAFRDLSASFLELYELPFIESEFDIPSAITLFELFKRKAADNGAKLKIFIEKAQVFPKNGAVGMFKYGRASGMLEGVVAALAIPHELVAPKIWAKEMHSGVSGKLEAKSKSALIVKRLFPLVNLKRTEKCKIDHDGFIDAILISEWAARKEAR